ncbi:MAG: hypothetical protein AAFO63_01745 [Pseudomonadota bacterium]
MTTQFRADVASGIFAILIGIFHLGAYLGLWWRAPESGTDFFWRIGTSVVLMVIVAAIIGIVSGVINRDALENDEREDDARHRSMRNLCFIYAGALAIILMEAFGTMTPMMLAHGVVAAFIVGEIVRLGSMGYYLARGV